MRPRAIVRSVVTTAAVLSVAASARGQEAPPEGWTNTAELSVVFTSGNASSSSVGFRGATKYRWPGATFQLSAGGLRTESETTTRTASGTPDDFTVIEETETELTAENYFARGRYDREVSEFVYFFGGAGWERNTFAGVENRFVVTLGTGHTWFDTDDVRLATDVGATYTLQDDVVEDPTSEDVFGGLRGSVDFFRRLTGTTRLESALIVDENLNETSDLRADWTTAVSVLISSNLTLKTSYQLLFDNEPSLVAVPLGEDEVFTPLEKVDGTLTVAVVVDF